MITTREFLERVETRSHARILELGGNVDAQVCLRDIGTIAMELGAAAQEVGAFDRLSDAARPAASPDLPWRDIFACAAMFAEIVTAGAVDASADALVKAANDAGRSVPDQIAFNSFSVAASMLRARGRS